MFVPSQISVRLTDPLDFMSDTGEYDDTEEEDGSVSSSSHRSDASWQPGSDVDSLLEDESDGESSTSSRLQQRDTYATTTPMAIQPMDHVAMDKVAFDLDGYGAEIAPHHIAAVMSLLPDKITLASKCGQQEAGRFFTSLDEFACIAISNYESASGQVWFVSRNKLGLSRKDIGKPRTDALPLLVTGADVDAGLNFMHTMLTAPGPFASKQPQLRRHRHADGNNCVWNVADNRRLHSVATKKVLRAISAAGLRLRIFEVNHKCALTDISVLVGILPFTMQPAVNGHHSYIVYLDSSLMAPYTRGIALYEASALRRRNNQVDKRHTMSHIYPAGPVDTPGEHSPQRRQLSSTFALVNASCCCPHLIYVSAFPERCRHFQVGGSTSASTA